MGKAFAYTAAVLAAGTAIYAGIGYVGIPWTVRQALEVTAADRIGRSVAVKDVVFNPWTLRLEVAGVEVSSRSGSGRLLTLKRAALDASARSVLELAPVIEALEVEGLDIVATLGEENLEELAQTSRTHSVPATGEKSALPGFAVYNISVKNSSLRVVDKTRGVNEKVSNFNLELPFVSTLSSARESLVTPSVSFELNGIPVKAIGRSRPFGSSLETELELKIAGLDAAPFARLVPSLSSQRLDMRSGRISTDLSLLFRNPTGGQPAKIILSGVVGLEGATLDTTVGGKKTPFIELERASASLREVNFVERHAALQHIEIDGLNITADARSALFASSGAAAPASAETSREAETSAAWRWSVADFVLHKGNIVWKDASGSIPIGSIEASVKNLDSAGATPAELRASCTMLDGTASVTGTVRPDPFEVNWSASASKLSLAKLSPYVEKAAGLAPAGTIGFEVDGNVSEASITAKGRLSASSLSVKSGKTTLASAQSASIEVDALNLTGRSLDVKRVHASGVDVRATRTASGFAGLPASAPAKADTKTGATAPTVLSDPWRWSVKEAVLEKSTLHWRDTTVKPVATATVSPINFTLKNLSSDASRRALVDLSAGIGGGTLHAAGKALPSEPSGEIELELAGIGLKPLSSVLAGYAGFGASSGSMRGSGSLTFDASQTKPLIKWKGDAAITEAVLTTTAGKPLVSWKSALLDAVEFANTNPVTLRIEKASIEAAGTQETRAVKKLTGLASAITALRAGKSTKTSERLDAVSEALEGSIELKNIRYEQGAFSANGLDAAGAARTILEKLGGALTEHLGTEVETKTP